MKVRVVIAVDPTMSRILPKSGIDSAINNRATTTPVLNSILRILKSELKKNIKNIAVFYLTISYYIRS